MDEFEDHTEREDRRLTDDEMSREADRAAKRRESRDGQADSGTDDPRHIEGVGDEVALRVLVIGEPLDAAQEALLVDVVVREDLDYGWAVGMLRQIADDLEAGAGS